MLITLSASQFQNFPASKLAGIPALRHIAFNINRFVFPDMFSFTAYIGHDSGIPLKIVFFVFTPMIHQQILFFIDQF